MLRLRISSATRPTLKIQRIPSSPVRNSLFSTNGRRAEGNTEPKSSAKASSRWWTYGWRASVGGALVALAAGGYYWYTNEDTSAKGGSKKKSQTNNSAEEMKAEEKARIQTYKDKHPLTPPAPKSNTDQQRDSKKTPNDFTPDSAKQRNNMK